ncbi:MAG TPA: FAD-binding protein [Gemmatimonadaceae bacterium]|nr:FAD-binding protein [Gemmatimonadaceae bacterium]
MQRRTFIQSTLTTAAGLALPWREPMAVLDRIAPHRQRDVIAVTGDGKDVTLTSDALADLAARLRGRLLLANDDGYDDARRILNPSFDKRPALIVQATGVADIRTAVDFARTNQGLLLAVKCGGHSLSGKSTCDRGMQLDLSHFRSVRVDPSARMAWVTGGSLLGAVDHEAMAHGLVTPLGTVSHTGVGGLVTGGGFGRLARRYGLSVDNLVAVDVVTADGQLRHASADENPDLFWGVRGGGGNFGVVTSFDFRLHPMQREVVAGRIMFPIARARDVLSLYADYAPEAPDELHLDCGVMLPPRGADGMAGFGICYSGPAGGADRALAPLRRLGTPLTDQVRTMDYVALQRSGDVDDPRAQGSYTKSGFVAEMRPELVTAIVEGLAGHPARSTQLFFQQGGGAIGRVAADATAFPQRDVQANMLCFVGWRHGDDATEHVRWIQRYWTGLEPYTHGFYVNDLEVDHSTAAVQANYRQNHDRLVAVKNRYDPANLFRLNANVRPSV